MSEEIDRLLVDMENQVRRIRLQHSVLEAKLEAARAKAAQARFELEIAKLDLKFHTLSMNTEMEG